MMRWQNVPWLVLLPAVVLVAGGVLLAYGGCHIAARYFAAQGCAWSFYGFFTFSFVLLVYGVWWYLKERPKRDKAQKEKAGAATGRDPIIRHTGPQYQIRWIRSRFESLLAAAGIIVFSLAALIGTFYFLYGDTRIARDLAAWAAKPMPLSLGVLFALTLESISAFVEEENRLYASGIWWVASIIVPMFMGWAWFLPPLAGSIFSVSIQGAVLPQGLVFGTMVLLSLYALWRSNWDDKGVLIGMGIIWVVFILGLQPAAVRHVLGPHT